MSAQISNTQHKHTPHHVLIGAPLVLILLFSFSFVLLQPAQPGKIRSASKTNDSKPTGAVAGASAALPTVEPAQSELTTLEPAAPVAEEPAAALAAPGAAPTSTPQAANKSGAVKSANPQTSSRAQQITPRTTINLPKAIAPLQRLLN